MSAVAKRRWIAVATIAVAFGVFYFIAAKTDAAASIRSVATQEIERCTKTPGSSWTIDVCEFDGTTWRVEAVAPLGGRVGLSISPDGRVLDYK